MAGENMASRTLLVTTALVGTLLAVAVGGQTPIGKAIWPPAELPAEDEPSSGQTAGFIGYSVYEALGFGLGLSLAVSLWPVVRERRDVHGLRGAYMAVTWIVLSWVPHDNLHMMVGTDPAGLLALEWAFHASLILAGLYLGRFLERLLTERGGMLSDASRATLPRRSPS